MQTACWDEQHSQLFAEDASRETVEEEVDGRVDDDTKLRQDVRLLDDVPLPCGLAEFQHEKALRDALPGQQHEEADGDGK